MLQECRHRTNLSLFHAILYCTSLSTLFVLSIYVFVPSHVRILPRDSAVHIRWRSAIVLSVMLIGFITYPRLFCTPNHMGVELSDENDKLFHPPWFIYLGFSFQPGQDLLIVIHVLLLYLGSLAQTWIQIFNYACVVREKDIREEQSSLKQLTDQVTRVDMKKFYLYVYHSFYQLHVQPRLDSLQLFVSNYNHRWIIIRNLIIAPLTEEIIFRACFLPPLLFSGLSSTQASWTAPLFFGGAHCHHHLCRQCWGNLSLSKKPLKETLRRLIPGPLVLQWVYTVLFGAYASHVFIRTGSIFGVILAHSLCNYMGLPDFSFIWKDQCYRRFLGWSYLTGIFLFIVGFDSPLFPSLSMLTSLVAAAK